MSLLNRIKECAKNTPHKSCIVLANDKDALIPMSISKQQMPRTQVLPCHQDNNNNDVNDKEQLRHKHQADSTTAATTLITHALTMSLHWS